MPKKRSATRKKKTKAKQTDKVPKTKKIRGKIYKYAGWTDTKRGAMQEAKHDFDLGYNVKIYPAKKEGKTKYVLYRRRS